MALKLGLVQFRISDAVTENMDRAVEGIRRAAAAGANVVCLPELFTCPYGTSHFRSSAELVPEGPTSRTLQRLAREMKTYVIAGSLPELLTREDNQGGFSTGPLIYNTCCVWSPEGQLVAKYRKIHLADCGKTFESETFASGKKLVMFDTPWARIGLGICYDVRFPELSQLYAEELQCQVLVFPAAFGKAGPKGDVLAEAGPGEDIVMCELDIAEIEAERARIPKRRHRRLDIYRSAEFSATKPDVAEA